jgi:tetratricopeptide (TPR) repeat protein
LGNRHPLVATSLHNLAGLHYGQGRYGEAQALLQQSLSIYQAQLGDRHPLVATNLNSLFVTYHVQGERAEALQALATALAIEEWHLDLNLAVLSDAQRQDYVADLATLVRTRPCPCICSHRPSEATAATLALTTVLRRKGRILDAGTNSLQSLRQNLSAVDQALLDELTTTPPTARHPHL